MKELLTNMLSLMVFLTLCFPTSAQDRQSLRLDQNTCRKMAIESSEDIHKAENETLKSRLDGKIATSAFLPAVNASGTGIYITPNQGMSGMEMILKGTYMAGITLTQPLYAGGRIVTGKRLSKIGEEAAEQKMSITRADVVSEADNAYWTYVSVQEKMRMVEELKAQMDTLLSQVSVSAGVGMATDADLLTVKAKRSEVEYQLQKVSGGMELCRMALCRVIGVPFDTRIVTNDAFLADVDSCLSSVVPNLSVESRPELKLLQAQVDVAKRQVQMTRGEYLPSLAVVGAYINYGNIKLSSMVDAGNGTYVPYEQKLQKGMCAAMLSLSIPIFHWGEGYNKVRKAKADVSNAVLDYQKNEKLMTLEACQSETNLRDSRALIISAKDALVQAEENLRVVSNRYSASMCPLSDYMTARFQWYQSRSNLIEAVTQYHIALTDYLRATGRLVLSEPDASEPTCF